MSVSCVYSFVVSHSFLREFCTECFTSNGLKICIILFHIFLFGFSLWPYYDSFCSLISCKNISLLEECLHCWRSLEANKTVQLNVHVPRRMLIHVQKMKLSLMEFFSSQIHKYALFCKISLCSLWLFFALCFINEVCVLWQIPVCSLFLLCFSLLLSSNSIVILLCFYKSCIHFWHML